jgi:hypothetical protein
MIAHRKYSTSSVPVADIALKFFRTCAPAREMQVPAGNGCPRPAAGVVVPSVVYLTSAEDAQTLAKRAPVGKTSEVGDVNVTLCWPGESGNFVYGIAITPLIGVPAES